jgi:hypothetical protein
VVGVSSDSTVCIWDRRTGELKGEFFVLKFKKTFEEGLKNSLKTFEDKNLLSSYICGTFCQTKLLVNPLNTNKIKTCENNFQKSMLIIHFQI